MVTGERACMTDGANEESELITRVKESWVSNNRRPKNRILPNFPVSGNIRESWKQF